MQLNQDKYQLKKYEDHSHALQQQYDHRKQSEHILQNNRYQLEYTKLLNLPQQIITSPSSQQISKLQAYNIKYSIKQFQQRIHIVVLNHTANYQILKLHVSQGKFSITLNLINIDRKNPISNSADCVVGGFGFVYKHYQNNSAFAIKCININRQRFDISFRQVIKEYLFLRIASALKIGPQLIKLSGFDIVTFRDTFLFSMQFCQIGKYRLNDSISSLKQKLYLLHRFNIVHLDVKPQNIGFSNIFKQYIFIDYGLSRMVKQQIGSKTYSNFVGSFNYCSPQMLELYLKQIKGFINLYYNDAFCLDKSLKFIECEQQMQSSEEQQIRRRRYGRNELQQIFIKLQIKYLFYIYSLGQTNFQDFSSQLNKKKKMIISANKYQFSNFINNLPQSFPLIMLYKQQLHQLFNKQSYEQEIQIQQIQQSLYLKRFQTIKQINCQQQVEEQIGVIDLFNLKKVKSFSFISYQLALIKFIQINNQIYQMSQKFNVCRIYNELYLKTQNIDDITLYKTTVKSIFQNSLQNFQSQAYKCLLNSIETTIILQLISQAQLIQVYVSILNAKLQFLLKMPLIFKFIESIQFIKYKYKTNYNYTNLSAIIFNNLSNFINKIKVQHANPQQIFVIKLLRYIMSYKIPQINSGKQSLEIINQSYFYSLTNQLQQLNQSIVIYVLYLKIQKSVESYRYYSEFLIKKLLIKLDKGKKFNYCHMYLLILAYQTNQIILLNKIYKLFLRKFSNLEQYKHFIIYFIKILANIKKIYLKSYFIYRKQLLSSQMISENEINFQQIYTILDYTIKNTDLFHNYLRYLLGIAAIQLSPICIKYISQLFCNNRETIMNFKCKDYHENSRYSHQNMLKKQIFVINKLLQIQSQHSNKQNLPKRQQFVNNCEQILIKYKCLKCKVPALLQMQIVYADMMLDQQKYEQSFLLLLQTVTLCLKHEEFIMHGITILTSKLIKIWVKSQYLFNKYDLIPLIYQIITGTRYYNYCFVDLKQYNLFFSLYTFIRMNYSQNQIVQFFVNLLHYLFHQQSMKIVSDFFYNWTFIVNKSKSSTQELQKFYLQHIPIVQVLVKQKKYQKNCYFTLLYSPFLQIFIKHKVSMKILKAISLSIGYLDHQTKNHIMNRYYLHVLNYSQSSKRKKKYLVAKYFKQSSQKFNLKIIIKKIIKNRSKSVYYAERKIKQLNKCIQKFHKNIGNLI